MELTRYYWAQLGGVYVLVVILVELEKIVAQLNSGEGGWMAWRNVLLFFLRETEFAHMDRNGKSDLTISA